MKIDVYTVCWNEELFMPFFLQHYNFATRVFIYDNMSTDETAVIAAKDRRCNILRLDTQDTFNEPALMNVKNQAWKQFSADADWVFIIDTDEFVFHENMLGYLAYCTKQGITRLTSTGYSMYSPGNPVPGIQLVRQVQRGIPITEYNKTVAFDPKAFEEINFHPGQHWCEPRGHDVVSQVSDLKLLHMTYVGHPSYRWSRMCAYTKRLSQTNLDNGWGKHYLWPYEDYRADCVKIAELAKPVI